MKFWQRTGLIFLVLVVFSPFTVMADLSDSRRVIIEFPDHLRSVTTDRATVEDVLSQVDVEMEKYDRIFPAPESQVVDGLRIFLYKIEDNENKGSRHSTAQKPRHRIVYSNALPDNTELIVRGYGVKATQGKNGSGFRPGVKLKGGQDYKNRQIQELQKQDAIRLMATGYSAHPKSTAPYDDGVTAIGLAADYGVVAVDPSVIPLGSRLYVEDYGYAIAADVGGGINGREIDLFFRERQQALKFGRQWVKVYVLG